MRQYLWNGVLSYKDVCTKNNPVVAPFADGVRRPAGSANPQSGRRRLRNAGKTGEEWLTYGLNPGETRYSPLNQINTSNVSRLGLAWSYDVGPGGGTQEATPLVSNGVMYSVTNWSIVFAARRAHRQGEVALGSGGEPG